MLRHVPSALITPCPAQVNSRFHPNYPARLIIFLLLLFDMQVVSDVYQCAVQSGAWPLTELS